MSRPDPARLFQAMDATWPAERFVPLGPWLLRQSEGAGQRVASASASGPVTADDITAAEGAMRAMAQIPLFQIRAGDAALDAALDARGYEIRDPVELFLAPVAALCGDPDGSQAVPAWPMLAIQRRLWAEAGIGPGRLAVMDRAAGPKATILARHGQSPAGTGFVALEGNIAMAHALAVRPECRRRGVAGNMLGAMARWAQDMGAAYVALAVTKENFAAKGLYAKNSMVVAGAYHYRRAEQ